MSRTSFWRRRAETCTWATGAVLTLWVIRDSLWLIAEKPGGWVVRPRFSKGASEVGEAGKTSRRDKQKRRCPAGASAGARRRRYQGPTRREDRCSKTVREAAERGSIESLSSRTKELRNPFDEKEERPTERIRITKPYAAFPLSSCPSSSSSSSSAASSSIRPSMVRSSVARCPRFCPSRPVPALSGSQYQTALAASNRKMYGGNANWALAIIVGMLLCRREAENGNDGRRGRERDEEGGSGER